METRPDRPSRGRKGRARAEGTARTGLPPAVPTRLLRSPAIVGLVVRARAFSRCVISYPPVWDEDNNTSEIPPALAPAVLPGLIAAAKALDKTFFPDSVKNDKLMPIINLSILHDVSSRIYVGFFIFVMNHAPHEWGWPTGGEDGEGAAAPHVMVDENFPLTLSCFMHLFYHLLYAWGWPGRWDDDEGRTLPDPLPDAARGVMPDEAKELLSCIKHLPYTIDLIDYLNWSPSDPAKVARFFGDVGRPDDASRRKPSPVKLGRSEADRPIVFGHAKKRLSRSAFLVVSALVKAGRSGLPKPELLAISSDGIGILKRLKRSDPDWADVIHFPGEDGIRGYRIGPPGG